MQHAPVGVIARRQQNQTQGQPDGRIGRDGLQLVEGQQDFGWRERLVLGDEGRDRRRLHVVGQVGEPLAMQDGEGIDLLHDVADVDGCGRRASRLHLVAQRPRVVGVTSLSLRFWKTCRISRSMMCLCIARVLSAMRASASQRSVISRKVLAAVSLRFGPLFSRGWEKP